MTKTVTYSVPKIHCAHCGASIKEEVSAVAGVTDVALDLETNVVTVTGSAFEDAAVRAAIEKAGYEAA